MNKTRVIAYGRMNPPTSGHALVLNKVKDIADKNKADHSVILSKTQDAKKNPLSAEDKVKFAKKIAPGVNVEAATKEHPTIMHHIAKAHDEGVEHLHIVAGSDRVEEYKALANKYHGPGTAKPFKSITVHSSGERDPDAEGETGISGTKMRQHASNNDVKSFKGGLPKHISHDDAHEMMKAVRKGMGLNENRSTLSFKDYILEEKLLQESFADELSEEAEKDGKKVKLNKPFRTPGGPKKFAVYVKNAEGNVIIVRFGDPNMEIKRDDPDRRKNFRARHNCDTANDKTSARYWSCKFWSNPSVSSLLSN